MRDGSGLERVQLGPSSSLPRLEERVRASSPEGERLGGRRLRVLALTRYGARAAGSRVRFLQYLPLLAREGIACDVAPFFDDRYVECMYAGRPRGVLGVARSFARRALELLASGRHDLVWLEEEAFPFLPATAERLLARRGTPLVLDCDDAIFHRYDRHPSGAVRALLGRKIDAVMASARLVLAGNAYLAERAERAGAGWVEIVPTVVDPERYPVRDHAPREPAVVAWIGTPRTARYLDVLRPALEPLVARGLARVLVIGGGDAALAGMEGVERRPWSEATEAADLASADVGLMPLPDGPFERGKCGYKLIQGMAAGLPVVASPVGANAEIVRHRETGFHARTEGDWRAALELLARDADLRRALGAAGRRTVEERWSLHREAPRLAGLLAAAVVSDNGSPCPGRKSSPAGLRFVAGRRSRWRTDTTAAALRGRDETVESCHPRSRG